MHGVFVPVHVMPCYRPGNCDDQRRASETPVAAVINVTRGRKTCGSHQGEGWRGVPSSLIVAALAAAWLIVLVPMIAKRRQEVVRTADSALAARVLRRDGARSEIEEVPPMSDDDLDSGTAAVDTGQPRRYRPGRGGFDPEAAELEARAKYAFRQRTLLGLLILAVTSAVLAALVAPMLWWLHVTVDLVMVGYLTYLRRQVRIEEDIRRRRTARLARRGCREPRQAEQAEQVEESEMTPEVAPERAPPMPRPVRHPSAVVVEADDGDPAFDDLDGPLPAYRRAAGQ